MKGTVVNVSADPMATLRKKLIEIYSGKKGKHVNVQPFSIRMETILGANFSGFQFDLGNRANMRALENELKDNDSFLMTHMSIGIYKDLVLTASFDRSGNAFVDHTPDLGKYNTLAATLANVSEADALQAIYGGNFSMKSDQEEVLLRLDAKRFETTPRTQSSATTRGSYEGEQYKRLHLNAIFDGSKSNIIDFKVAKNADTAQIAGDPLIGQNVMVVETLGFLVRGGNELVSLPELRAANII